MSPHRVAAPPHPRVPFSRGLPWLWGEGKGPCAATVSCLQGGPMLAAS